MQRSLHAGLIKIRDISVAGSNVRTAGFAIRGPPPGWNKTGHRGGCTRLSRTILYYDLAWLLVQETGTRPTVVITFM